MKVTVKKIDALRREMHFEVPKERVLQKQDEVLKEIAKHAKIPGFRTGKAPKKLVETSHGKFANEEMLKNLIPEVYREGVEQEKLDPIDLPAIDNVELKDGTVKFRATFDVRPEVEVGDYKGIPVTKKSSEVADDEVVKTLDYFKKGRGLADDAVLDDAFAKGMGFPTLEELKKSIKRNMEYDKDRQNRAEVENQIIDELIKRSKLHVPLSLVERQAHGRQEEFVNRLKSYGAKDEDIKKKLEESAKQIKEAAEKDVRIYLILQKIAQLEKIEAGEGENLSAKVMEFLFKEAKWELALPEAGEPRHSHLKSETKEK
jgi:FKBP-type peptidyl-prolyl cis-trans isomerase (trigger factor)